MQRTPRKRSRNRWDWATDPRTVACDARIVPDWNDPSVVASFARQPPDRRVVAAVEDRWIEPPARVLDVGCAGGRNAAYLASRGFAVSAVDASPAMVHATRERLRTSAVRGAPPSVAVEGRIGALDEVVDGRFDLVLALGVLQHARSDAEFDAAVADVARLVAPRGRVIVAHFTPASRPHGRTLRRLPGTAHAYAGWEGPDHVMTLHGAEALDAIFAAHGLVPATPSSEVERAHVDVANRAHRRGPDPVGERPPGLRVTCNAVYRPVHG